MENSTAVDKNLFTEGKINENLNKYLPSPKYKLYRLENLESCWDYIEDNSIESFVKTFCNETLTKVYRLMLFSTEIKLDNFFLYYLKRAIERESLKRNFDCFQLVKQNKCDVIDVIYNEEQIIYLSD